MKFIQKINKIKKYCPLKMKNFQRMLNLVSIGLNEFNINII